MSRFGGNVLQPNSVFTHPPASLSASLSSPWINKYYQHNRSHHHLHQRVLFDACYYIIRAGQKSATVSGQQATQPFRISSLAATARGDSSQNNHHHHHQQQQQQHRSPANIANNNGNNNSNNLNKTNKSVHWDTDIAKVEQPAESSTLGNNNNTADCVAQVSSSLALTHLNCLAT